MSRKCHCRGLLLPCLVLLLALLLSSSVFAASTIAGSVLNSGGTPYVGCSVALYAGTSTTPTATTTTISNGHYYFTNVADGQWTVKPGKDGVTFSPVYRTYTVASSTITDANFTGTETSSGSVISGYVLNSGGTPYVGCSVALYAGTSTTPTTTTTTISNGRYYFTNVAAGQWTVKPGKDGVTFSPVYRTYTVAASTITDANFTGTETSSGSAISGVIKDATGTALAGVSVGLYAGTSPSATATTTTTSLGAYSFSHLAAGSWTVRPAKDGVTFSPVYRTYTLPPSATEASFTGTVSSSAIAGTIKDSAGAAMAGVSVALYAGTSSTPTATTTTTSLGAYSFVHLAAGSWTVKPSKDGTTFSPVYRTYALPPTVSVADFTGSGALTGSFISGLVKNAAGAAMANVSVGLYQNDQLLTSATTNTEGRYYLVNLAAGTYVVRPSQSGVAFDPVSKSVTLPPSVTTVNFGVISLQRSTISGLVRTSTGVGLVGVSVGLYQNDVLKQSAVTSTEGRYTFSNLTDGTYVVRPSTTSYAFDPVSRSVVAPPGTTAANFTGAARILPTLREGVVSPTTGTTRTLFTFSVIYTDTANREPTAAYVGVDGHFYRLVKMDPTDANYADGCRYYYKLMLATGSHQYRFIFYGGGTYIRLPGPADSNCYTGPTVTGDTYSISGVIATPESRLPGVSVTIVRDGMDPVVVQTNSEGRYTALGLQPGQYTVTPAKPGCTFNPPYKTVTLPASTISCNFYATVQ